MRVGIVTRTKDRPFFVRRALASVLAQAFPDWHLVLVNDGGDAAALETEIADLIEGLDKRKLTLLHLGRSVGRAAAFNRGLGVLETELVACLDDDDRWDPAFLAELVAFYDENKPLVPDLGGVACQVTAIREELVRGPDGRLALRILGEDGLPNAFRRRDFLINPIAYGSYRQDLYPVQWLLERAPVAALGGFPEQFAVMEDRAFLMRFLQHRRIALLDRPLAFHHRRIERQKAQTDDPALNTLDNPLYDWRRFADLAFMSPTSPANAPDAGLANLIRAALTLAVKELNDETSALWHKVDTEAKSLREALERLADRLAEPAGALPKPTFPSQDVARSPQQILWDMWQAVGTKAPLGFGVEPGQRFAERLALSTSAKVPGFLFYADPVRGWVELQLPATETWCALELDLTGVVKEGQPLVVTAALGIVGGGLFETGLMCQIGRRFELHSSAIHASPERGFVSVERRFAPPTLKPEFRPKFSIVLPRKAHHLRLQLAELRVALP